MKITKKKISVMALVVSLIAIVSLGTLAWFTAEDSVTNKFFVADTNTPDAEGIFGIDVWEYDEDSNKIAEGDVEDGIVFEEIIAGDELTKEPHFENTGIHPMWVRATVTITGADVLKEAIGDVEWMNPDKLLSGIATEWIYSSSTYNPQTGELVHTYYYSTPLEKGAETTALFDTVNIPEGLTVEQAERLDAFDIVILGEAIQSENLGVTTAKDAFDTYWEEANTSRETLAADMEFYGDVEPINYAEPNSAVFTNAEWESDDAVAENLVTVGTEATNSVVHFVGGDYTLQDDDCLVYNEGAGAVVVYVWSPVTVNGEELTRANYEDFFGGRDMLVYFQY